MRSRVRLTWKSTGVDRFGLEPYDSGMRIGTKWRLVVSKASWLALHPIRGFRTAVQSRRLYGNLPFLDFPPYVAKAIGRPHPRYDLLLTSREPRIVEAFDEASNRIDVSRLYQPAEELRVDSTPYSEFASYFCDAGLLNGIESITDLGCSTGHLLACFREEFGIRDVKGVEAFPFHQEAAPESVRDCITISDLRDPLPLDLGSDLVVCTEVGEHIEPARIGNLMDNLARLTRKILVLTWSGTYPPAGAPPQHLSSLSKNDVSKLLVAYGFRIDALSTARLERLLRSGKQVYPWWLDSLIVARPMQ